MRPGLAGVESRLARIEERLGVMGGGSGVKYREELAWWRWLITTDEGRRSLPGSFDQVFGRWQRDRLRELGRCIGLENDGDLDAWCARQSAVEIGPGPYPALAAAPVWLRAVAVDPLARGYADEGLIPSSAAHVVFVEATGERVPLPTAFADLVIIENALDHVSDPAAVLSEISRLLRAGGLLWLLVDLSNHRDHMHPHSFNAARARSLARDTGFEVVRDRVSDHKSHPKAYGEYRALLRKPGGQVIGEPSVEVRVGAETKVRA
jgi:SAM-dependent methyltransferase